MAIDFKDRVPTKTGRVLITPENGSSAYYATMARADEPSVTGTPINRALFNQLILAANHPLSSSAQSATGKTNVDDALCTLDNIKNGICTYHNNYEITDTIIKVYLRINKTNAAGVSVIVRDEIVTTGSDGSIAIPAKIGGSVTIKTSTLQFLTDATYTLSNITDWGIYTVDVSIFTKPVYYESSCSIQVPAYFVGKSYDIFCCGGGGAGSSVAFNYGSYSSPKIDTSGYGGGGGYTTTKTVTLGSTLTINIGAGGGGVPSNNGEQPDNTIYYKGGNGGDTTVTTGTSVITASGGTAGTGSSWYDASGAGSGGSGGGVYAGRYGHTAAGGTNGSNGGGTGQGTTTYAFGDTSCRLCSGGGGVVYINNIHAKGGDASAGTYDDASVRDGRDGYGGGGAGSLDTNGSLTGNGGSGVVAIRPHTS